MRDDRPTIIFAGGGTGGHVSPGLAVAESLAERASHVERLFVCSERTIDARMLSEAGETFIPIGARPFSVSPKGAMRFLLGWRKSERSLRAILVHRHVSAVLALGGFVAAPSAYTAARSRIPVVLLNLDSTPGRANRLAARWATEIVSACDTPKTPRFSHHRVPMPLRRRTIAPGSPEKCRRELRLDADTPTLLVTGASQGSGSLNDFMIAIARGHPNWLAGWQVYHLSGADRDEEVRAAYTQSGIAARVDAFQSDMGIAWGAAELVISRAGANSVAEIAANTVPAVFFPYPHHRDRHQSENAEPLRAAGGAVVFEDYVRSDVNLAKHGDALATLLADRNRRASMRENLQRIRPKNGADEVASLLLRLSGC